MKKCHVIAGISLAGLSACKSEQIPVSDTNNTAELEERIDALERQVENNTKQRISLTSELKPSVWLRQSDRGYTSIRSDVGMLSFQLEDITPRGSGTRLTVRIGNPNYATITQLSLKGEFGKLNQNGEVDFSTARPFNSVISDKISPGSWSKGMIDIEGINPSEFGYLQIATVSTDSMTLNLE